MVLEKARPQMVVQTIDDFKDNMKLLSQSLSIPDMAPRGDLSKFHTWIPWVNNSGTPMHKAHFYGSAVPEVTRTLLQRKYPDPIADPRLVPHRSCCWRPALPLPPAPPDPGTGWACGWLPASREGRVCALPQHTLPLLL